MSRVLVVDDVEAVRVVITRYLQTLGHEVVSFDDGKPAIEWLSSTTAVDVILTDIQMPTSGIEVTRAARATGFAGPIILMTADPSILERKCLNLENIGAQGLLAKPFRWRTLAQALERLDHR